MQERGTEDGWVRMPRFYFMRRSDIIDNINDLSAQR